MQSQAIIITKLLNSVTEFITNYVKYYKVRQVLQSVTLLLQSASGVTKRDRLLLQSASGIKKCDSYYKVRRNILY